MMIIGIGMPIAQARMPFMAVLLSLLQRTNADGGGLVPGGDKGLTAGWAQRCWFWALYGSTSPGDVLLEMLQKRLVLGGEPD